MWKSLPRWLRVILAIAFAPFAIALILLGCAITFLQVLVFLPIGFVKMIVDGYPAGADWLFDRKMFVDRVADWLGW